MKGAPSAETEPFFISQHHRDCHMPEMFFHRDALPADVRATIHSLLAEAAKRRPLTRQEIRLRCITAPRPWRDAGVSPSTFYRRRKRALLAAQLAEAA
jgi:hypothetical protein